MKLGFFTMPIHPLEKDWRQSLKEDREAFILADQLGYVEGYVGEHVTDKAENITSSITFIATLIDATKRIKLGTGTINMPNNHPAAVAANIAMLDHLLDGRLILGISPGGLLSDAEVFGNLNANRNEMFVEAINQVLAVWASDPPYSIKGKYWTVTTERTLVADIGQGILARLGADHGQLPVAGMGEEPLAQVRGGLPKGGAPGRSGQLAGRAQHLRRRRRQNSARLCDGAHQPIPALLQQPPRQTQNGRARRRLQGAA
jgi:alkanesulfonate monooxygenase SsuD/methylene tetrahydromethanopterin reductase-like flavin-dependent oxidoreductase (luciferase family)